MAERPILFSAPMVRAGLEGRLSQTRLVLTKRAAIDALEVFGPAFLALPGNADLVGYAPGDRLYVREAWRVGAWNSCDGGIAVDYLADGFARKEWLYHPDFGDLSHYRFIKQSKDDARRAGLMADDTGGFRWSPGDSPCRIRAAIHMPRWASRLTLTVTDVRVQRLQDISEADAWAEGCEPGETNDRGEPFPAEQPHPEGGFIGWDCARDWFADLWSSIHGPDAWDRNDWVVALTFTVHRGNIDQIEATP